ncbi:SIR2 family protein [Clostridium butyricum]|uniref:hypothetical protein n=1 Tax=Clostridium butyricum TaxID=1492 RepID=UPI00374F5955
MADKRYLEKKLKDDFIKLLESNNINLLLGAGFCANILSTLGSMERLMEIVQKNVTNSKYYILESLLYWNFFENSIYPMVEKLNDSNILNEQREFLSIWKEILNIRESKILLKQINIFTTNYDVILELTMEEESIEYNDGFQGRINPYFSISNYNRIYHKQTLFTNRISVLPIFNIYKIHGSITWKSSNRNDGKFIYSNYIDNLVEFHDLNKNLLNEKDKKVLNNIINIDKNDINEEKVKSLIEDLEIIDVEKYMRFTEFYKSTFKIVNPTKQKFYDTIVNKNYYELLRIYCNELERENTLVIAFGFSFCDEHILDMTKRALNNPSLLLIIFSYKKEERDNFLEMFKENNNVWVIGKNEWREKDETDKDEEMQEDLHEVAIGLDASKVVLDITDVNNFMQKIIKGKYKYE